MTPRSGFSPMPTPNGSHRNLAQTTNGLGINIEIPPPHSPHGHARNDSTASSPLLSPLSATKTRISSMLSPAARRNNPPASRTESTLIDTENNDTTPNDTNNNDRKQATTSVDSTTEPFPNIEISVARSVSVSKGKKKQVVVPVGPKSDRLVPEMGSGGSQRKGKGKTPKVMDAHHGHRHGNSHDVRIENAD